MRKEILNATKKIIEKYTEKRNRESERKQRGIKHHTAAQAQMQKRTTRSHMAYQLPPAPMNADVTPCIWPRSDRTNVPARISNRLMARSSPTSRTGEQLQQDNLACLKSTKAAPRKTDT